MGKQQMFPDEEKSYESPKKLKPSLDSAVSTVISKGEEASLKQAESKEGHSSLFDSLGAKTKEVLSRSVENKDAEKAMGVSLDKKERNQVLKDLGNKGKMKKIQAKVDAGEQPKGLKDQFTAALLHFTPQLVGLAAGALFEGAEGAVAGAEEGAKISQQIQGIEQQAKQSELAQRKMAIDETEADLKAKEADRDFSIAKAQLGLKERALDIQEKKNLADLVEAYKKANPDAKSKLVGLASEEKKRLGSVMTADRSLNEMIEAIEQGENLFEIWGESRYTDARNRFVESIARLQSGAAISDTEFDIYTGFAPASPDARALVENKMRQNRVFIDDQLNISGFTRQELNLPVPLTLKNKDELIQRRNELLAKRGQ